MATEKKPFIFKPLTRGRRALIMAVSVGVLYLILALIGIEQERQHFENWVPYPLWILSLPGSFLLSPLRGFIPSWHYLSVNTLLWAGVGFALGYLTPRLGQAALIFLGLLILLGVGLYTVVWMIISHMSY